MAARNPKRMALAASIASVVCSQGDPERFFENMKHLREKSLKDKPDVCEAMAAMEKLVLALNRELQKNPDAQPY